MPEGDRMSRGSPEMTPPSDEYPSSAATMIPQRAPPAYLCAQEQTPHRVQSSTNLDLVDCVGSDLLLAMNSLDVSEQARLCAGFANGSRGGSNHGNSLHDGGGGGICDSPQLPPPGDEFLPLAALAPPPSRQPAWHTCQQQSARVQNEYFPSRDVFRGGLGGGGADGDEAGADGGRLRGRNRSSGGSSSIGGGPRRDACDLYPEGSSTGSMNSSSNHRCVSSGGGGGGGSPGMPPPGFGLDSCSSQGSWSGSNNGSTSNNGPGRRPSSSNSNGHANSADNSNSDNPHLDESWTAVLNAPAGAELMEFLTERASRALVLWNVEALGEDQLRASCEAHGPLYYLRAEHRRKRVIFVGYYDVRDAVNAHRCLGGELSKLLMNEHGSRPRPAVHFSIELHAGFSYKEGTLVVHNLPAQATEAEVARVFRAYGDVRDIRGHSNPGSFSVEFYSIQDAGVAAQELTVRNPWGHGVTVEPAVRSEGERALGRQLHGTLNRWTVESAQVNDDRMRSTSSSIVMSGRSSGSDSPPPKPEDYGYNMMDHYTPMTSANTTPATTPGSTPPSGADVYENAGGRSARVHYTMPLRQHYSGSARPVSSSSRSMHAQHHNHLHHQQQQQLQGYERSFSGSSSAPPHLMYASSGGSSNGTSVPQHHYGGGSSGASRGQQHHSLAVVRNNGHHSSNLGNGGGSKKPLPAPYCSPSPGGGCSNGFYADASPGYHPRDGTRTPPTPMWTSAAAASFSLSPPSLRGGGGMRGSPSMRGARVGGPGGLGYKDRCRQMSLDEGRLLGGGGARTMRSSSDSTSMIMATAHGSGGGGGHLECNGNGGHEYSLDLKQVAKGMDKRTTIMVRNIPNKYTQTMLLQEIDASYRGSYDFFYLPIDFKNKCNVGYAFINFIDYKRIIPFFSEFNAQRWKNFNSEKVCAISYARIQGKASMISRFQNSSLMEKDGEYRPLIFHSAGPDRGRPEPFPASSKAYRGIGALPGGDGGGGSGGGSMFGGGRDRESSMSNSSSLSVA